MHSFHVPRQGLGCEELVTLGAVDPRHGVLGRARPPSVRQGHVGALGPQGHRAGGGGVGGEGGGGIGGGGGGGGGVQDIGHPGLHGGPRRGRGLVLTRLDAHHRLNGARVRPGLGQAPSLIHWCALVLVWQLPRPLHPG